MKLRFAYLRLGDCSQTYNRGGPYHGLDRLSLLAGHLEGLKVPTLTLAAIESLDPSQRENLVVFIAGNLPMKTEVTALLIITRLEQYDYSGATALAVVMLLISFMLLVGINLLQAWIARRGRKGG